MPEGVSIVKKATSPVINTFGTFLFQRMAHYRTGASIDSTCATVGIHGYIFLDAASPMRLAYRTLMLLARCRLQCSGRLAKTS